MEEPKYCVAFTADDRFCSLCNQGKGCVELAKNYKNKIPTMSKEEGKPEEDKYLTIVTPDLMYWKSVAEELKKENEELKLKLSGKTFFDEKEVIECQLSKAKELLENRYKPGGHDEIELFLKS